MLDQQMVGGPPVEFEQLEDPDSVLELSLVNQVLAFAKS
jgi:hypothetical protein